MAEIIELLSGIPTEPSGNIGNSSNMASVISSSITESSGTLNGLNVPNFPGKSGLEIEPEIAEAMEKTDVGSSDKVVIPPELAEVPADKLEKLVTSSEFPTKAFGMIKGVVASVEPKSGSFDDAGKSLGSSEVNPTMLDNLEKLNEDRISN
jgi:hypothetical protein